MTELDGPLPLSDAWYAHMLQEEVAWTYEDARRPYSRGMWAVAVVRQLLAAVASAAERHARGVE